MLGDTVELRLREALAAPGRSVYDHESSVKAIQFKKSEESDLDRFLAWNVLLGVLDKEEGCWTTIWTENHLKYWSECKENGIDTKEWVEIEKESDFFAHFKHTARPKMLSDIIKDVYRTCITLIPVYYPQKNYSLIDTRRIARILYSLSIREDAFGYIQGYDRMAFIMFVLSANFCGKNFLPDDLAESMAYSLTMRIISYLNFRKHMESEVELTMWIQGYQDMLERYRPNIAKRVQNHKIVPIQYTFRWLAVMFADEHKSTNIFVIWDQCILHLSHIDQYLFSMAVAHISEANDRCRDDKNFVEFLHKNKEWDVEKIIMSTNDYFNKTISPASHKSSCCTGFLGVLWT